MTWKPLEPERGRDPEPLAGSLDRLARRCGVPSTDALSAVFARWPEVVGPTAAEHSRPVSLSGRVLVVAVYEPAWATELRYLGGEVLRRLEEVAGGPVADRLELRVRPPN